MRLAVLVVAVVLATGAVAAAATPAPKPTAPKRINVEQLQPEALFPKRKLHTEVVVETNRMGQVARVASIKPSHDQQWDARMYGNALQAFIRTPDGNALAGTYRLTYDYDPKPKPHVHREVALIKAGGVNPDAKGAATEMMEIARRNGKRTPPPVLNSTPGPAPSVRRLPDLPQVMNSPSH